jgi:hypothetical protein
MARPGAADDEVRGYFSENSPSEVRQELRRSEVLVNGEVRDDVICCDTEIGFAICFVSDPEQPGKRGAFWKKRDPKGYKGLMAAELVWGTVEVRPLPGEKRDQVDAFDAQVQEDGAAVREFARVAHEAAREATE